MSEEIKKETPKKKPAIKKATPKKVDFSNREKAGHYKKVEIEFNGKKQFVSEDIAEVLQLKGLIK